MIPHQLAFDIDAREEVGADDCLYAAGFFDGEGCINLGLTGRTNRVARAQLVLGNTNLPILEWLRDHWGGQIYQKRDTIERRPQWQWCLSERRMVLFLEDVAPHLRVKAPAAQNAQAFLRLKLQRKPHARVTNDEAAQLLPFVKAHQALELDLRPDRRGRRRKVA